MRRLHCTAPVLTASALLPACSAGFPPILPYVLHLPLPDFDPYPTLAVAPPLGSEALAFYRPTCRSSFAVLTARSEGDVCKHGVRDAGHCRRLRY